MMGPSKPPTKDEKHWMDAVAEFGCVVCRRAYGEYRPAAVHHIVGSHRLLGHIFTIGLCDPGHHQNGQQFGMISRHPYKARFEAAYGTELELLEYLTSEMDYGRA